ncbi:hypothetical protein MtrunA17_Chr4g0020941 [Medicago truncatula]|uniref:Uncharacterized protein n=1 Tax=Medicago truncatula TaxID=3880 RepID=A0A396IB32_MEDTR|nr:hypothetical protein MtrunA17_Chr4g0020941 [Medicago truncatula]
MSIQVRSQILWSSVNSPRSTKHSFSLIEDPPSNISKAIPVRPSLLLDFKIDSLFNHSFIICHTRKGCLQRDPTMISRVNV